MRRLIAVAAAVVVVGVIAGCTGETEPPTDVTNNAATMNAKVSCDTGEAGFVWFRYSNWVPSGWQQTPSQWFDCSKGAQQNLAWPVRVTSGLLPDTSYVYELCSTVGKPAARYPGDHALTNPVTGCVDQRGDKFATSQIGPADDIFHTRADVYNQASDPGQSWPASMADDPVDGRAAPVESGAGTGYDCGWVPSGWRIVTSVGLKAFKGNINAWHLCWGTGHNRGTFKNVDDPVARGEISAWGEYTGWRYDGVVGEKGPYTENGKKKFMRNLQFHACEPPKGPCAVTTRIVQLQFWYTFWTDSNNVGRYTRTSKQWNVK